MALITDPDSLSQGTLNNVADLAFTASAGATTTITGATTLPALADNEWFEIRSANLPGNNGLYRVADAAPTTSSIDIEKFTGPNPTNDTASSTDILGTTGASTEKSVMFDTNGLEIYLFEQGNLSVDGVTMLALHSFAKEEWKGDALLIASASFPITGISFAAGQWVLGQDPSGNNSGWKFAEDITAETQLTRKLVRNAGWDELDSSGNTIRKFFNVTTLGTFEDTADLAYYRFGTDATDAAADIDYTYADAVNEPVLYFREFGNPDTCVFATTSTITRATGSFIADGYQVGGQVTVRNAEIAGNNGTYVLTAVAALTLTVAGTPLTTDTADATAQLAVDNSNVFETFIRIRDADPEGKTFNKSNLAGAGETAVTSKIIKFPLANATDLDITATDASITGGGPWTEILIRYLAETYNRDVDTSGVPRSFGIVVDVGTYSQANGVSDGTAVFDSAGYGDIGTAALSDFNGGTLTIHEGTDKGIHTISGTPVDNAGTLEITLSSALSGSESNLSFTMQRATPVSATKNQIYEKVQYLLRQSSDIDGTTNTVIGRTADELCKFIGPDLRFGQVAPVNPNSATDDGVICEGFASADSNNMYFYDNGGTQRAFPFVASGTFTFNQGLVDDTDGEYWLYFDYTSRTTNSDIDVVGPSGDTYDLEGTLPNMAVNDYIQISGFAQAENNGLFIVTAENTPSADYTVRKVDGSAVGTAETNQTVNVDENPYPSPDAVIVQDNGGTNLAAAISTTSVAFDFAYTTNTQGGRTADTDANVVLIAAGLETGQVTVVSGLTITKTTGLSFSIVAPLERNYENL